jgi:cellulose synthase/poly-beta-1,6-N-acetylglucosamine synthase-like glycosyltransferase
MPIVDCPGCGHGISDRATVCVNCGQLLTPAPAPLEPIAETPVPSTAAAIQEQLPFFSVATHKFVVMCLATVGLYQYYWLFLQWRRLARGTIQPLSPFWRTFFAPLWGFSFCSRIHNRAALEKTSTKWSAGLLATGYFVLSIAWRLPDPWWLVSLLSFVPLIPVQRTIEQINARHVDAALPNRSYSTTNLVGIVIGGLVLLLAIAGLFLPNR